jgi:diadenosine tetraphosphate (Ap4A) HIT family hydrolase
VDDVVGETLAMERCKTCELVSRRDAGSAPPWDRIWRTAHWDVVHAYGTSHQGWLVLVTRVHRSAIADLTDAEARELGPLLVATSAALGVSLGAVKTYVAQFAEHPLHPHVHFHVIARRADHPDEFKGPGIFGTMADDATIDEARMNSIAEAVAGHFGELGVPGGRS